MTREEAQYLVQSYLGALGQPSPGLNAKGLGGVALEEATLYFEHLVQEQALKASALIYRFRGAPKPGLLEGFRQEEVAGTETGGGRVDYEPESQSLFLSRTYSQVPPLPLFQSDMRRLAQASRLWSDEVVSRVAERVFGHSR